jgi:AcrR family transcriptional regulator
MSEPRRYRTGDEKRKSILHAAFETFSKVGYNGSSLREIAGKVGTSHVGLLYHFKSKAELLMEVLEYRDDHDSKTLPLLSDDPRESLHATVDLAALNATRRGMIELFTLVGGEATNPEHPAHDFFVERYRKVCGVAERAFKKLKEEGALKDDVDPVRAGQETMALMDGLQTQWLLDVNVDMPGSVQRQIESYFKDPSDF